MKQFYSTDIVVWNGIIADYGNIKHLINETEYVVFASEYEKTMYNKIR